MLQYEKVRRKSELWRSSVTKLLGSERMTGEQWGVGGQDGSGCAIREVGELGREINAALRIPKE